MSSRRTLTIAVILSVVVASQQYAMLRADDDLFTAVSGLLDAGWKPSARGLDAAKSRYVELQQSQTRDANRADAGLIYAYALVQLRNRRYDDARQLLDEVLAADKLDIAARRAKIWLLVVLKNYSAALVEMELLAKSLPAESAAESEADYKRHAEFLGRVFAFLDGPGAAAVADHVRADARKRILTTLLTGRRQAFDDGYLAVTNKYEELDLDRQQTKADAKATEEKRVERLKDDLETQRVKLTQERGTLETRADKINGEFAKEIADLDRQLAPLISRQGRLESQAAAIIREISSLQAEISRLLELSELADDPVDAARFRAEARRLDSAVGRYDIDLRGLRNEVGGIVGQRVGLESRRQSAIGRQQAETDRIDRRLNELRGTEKRVSIDEKKASQPVVGNTASVASLAAKAAAFTTYEEFPFEEERARLLQSLRK